MPNFFNKFELNLMKDEKKNLTKGSEFKEEVIK